MFHSILSGAVPTEHTSTDSFLSTFNTKILGTHELRSTIEFLHGSTRAVTFIYAPQSPLLIITYSHPRAALFKENLSTEVEGLCRVPSPPNANITELLWTQAEW